MLECSFCDNEAEYKAPLAPGFGKFRLCESHRRQQDWEAVEEL